MSNKKNLEREEILKATVEHAFALTDIIRYDLLLNLCKNHSHSTFAADKFIRNCLNQKVQRLELSRNREAWPCLPQDCLFPMAKAYQLLVSTTNMHMDERAECLLKYLTFIGKNLCGNFFAGRSPLDCLLIEDNLSIGIIVTGKDPKSDLLKVYNALSDDTLYDYFVFLFSEREILQHFYADNYGFPEEFCNKLIFACFDEESEKAYNYCPYMFCYDTPLPTELKSVLTHPYDPETRYELLLAKAPAQDSSDDTLHFDSTRFTEEEPAEEEIIDEALLFMTRGF